jgi:hypothetical protein
VAQENTVTVNPEVQKFIGDVSELDRGKYFLLHANGNDPQLRKFYEDYNVERTGRGFKGPGKEAKNITGRVGVYPEVTDKKTDIKLVNGYVTTEHPKDVYKEGVDIEGFSDWTVQYFKGLNESDMPSWYEPMNEPFVHAPEFYDEPGWDPVAALRVKREMCELYKALGEKINAEPALSHMRVIGFASAWPHYEQNDFRNWEVNMKLFMDIAGEHMDAISYHLYSSVTKDGHDYRRAGSNNDAMMDLIETYSFFKWGAIKPHAVTEYGGLEGKEFSLVKNAQSVRSQNAMIFGLFDRQDRLEFAIPFTVDKASWHITEANNFMPYKAVLWRPDKMGVPLDQVNEWVFTDRIHFYSLWKAVKGMRVFVSTSNPDIQAQAFVDKRKLFLALNNLDHEPQRVKLLVGERGLGVNDVLIKSLTVPKDAAPTYHEKEVAKSPTEISLNFGETVVLEYELQRPVKFKQKLKTTRYYHKRHIQPIVAGEKMKFDYSSKNPAKNIAYASLSLGIGRNPQHSKQPSVRVNGKSIDVPTNWKGYSQEGRKTFFGTIEIPVAAKLIKAKNTVTISFPDSGGHVSSLVLNVTQAAGDAASVRDTSVNRSRRGTARVGAKVVYEIWTSKDGAKIEARFLGLQGDSVMLMTKNGRAYVVPFSRLSAESLAMAKHMAEKK